MKERERKREKKRKKEREIERKRKREKKNKEKEREKKKEKKKEKERRKEKKNLEWKGEHCHQLSVCCSLQLCTSSFFCILHGSVHQWFQENVWRMPNG